MIRVIVAVAALVTLTACGVDGPPEAPSDVVQPGFTVTGDARYGVVGPV